MATTKKITTKTAAPKKVAAKTTAKKVTPSNLRGVAQSIAALSHEDRVKLHQGFTKNIDADNNTISVGRTPDGSNYTEWVNSFE